MTRQWSAINPRAVLMRRSRRSLQADQTKIDAKFAAAEVYSFSARQDPEACKLDCVCTGPLPLVFQRTAGRIAAIGKKVSASTGTALEDRPRYNAPARAMGRFSASRSSCKGLVDEALGLVA